MLIVGSLLLYAQFFGPADPHAEAREFIVKPDASVFEITRELRQAGFVKSSTAFSIAYRIHDSGRGIQEGGYELSASMDTSPLQRPLLLPPILPG